MREKKLHEVHAIQTVSLAGLRIMILIRLGKKQTF